ncbi:MAG: radical SAM protein [Candidatus Goldiibacteriota bacterium]
MYIFGPVPSRRLGLSLGVDLLKEKHCNLNCVYCELGKTRKICRERKIFVETQEVISEIKEYFKSGKKADVVTFSGNGEPLLAENLGDVIRGIRSFFSGRIALLTNGVFLYDKKARQDAALADIVLPSIDAGSDSIFRKINRPAKEEDFERYINGLVKFSAVFKGEIWAEVLLVKGINDSDEAVKGVKKIIDKMENVSRIQVNTIVRSRAEKSAEPVSRARLERAAEIFGETAEIIGGYEGGAMDAVEDVQKLILKITKFRPVSSADMAKLTGLPEAKINEYVEELRKKNKLEFQQIDGAECFKAK